MTSPQKAKGSSFEREAAKFLSDLYSENFMRVPNSGAYIGGKNNARKQVLHPGQLSNFKGDIIPGPSFVNFNAEAKSYADFPFHLMLTGDCKQLDVWLGQLMSVADKNDCNILLMKFNRKGKYIAVQTKYTWVTDNFILYTSKTQGDWILVEFDHFFKLNKDLFKAYCGPTLTSSLSSNNAPLPSSTTINPT